MKKVLEYVGLIMCVSAILILSAPALARKSGGGIGGGESIKVNKCEYAGTEGFVELLINAGSSNSTAHLYAYLPSGAYLGEVRNGGGGRYGGTVFVAYSVPATITINSSAGGAVTALCVPFQP